MDAHDLDGVGELGPVLGMGLALRHPGVYHRIPMPCRDAGVVRLDPEEIARWHLAAAQEQRLDGDLEGALANLDRAIA